MGKTEFNDYFANGGPSVQERWLGPESPLSEDEEEGIEGEEREGPENEEHEEGYEDQVGGQEGEDTQGKDTSYTLLTGLSIVHQWLRYHWQKWWKPSEAKKVEDENRSHRPSMGLSPVHQ